MTDINRLRELAGIPNAPANRKQTKLDEGIIGNMQRVRHVSEADLNWNDHFDNDREAGIQRDPEPEQAPEVEATHGVHGNDEISYRVEGSDIIITDRYQGEAIDYYLTDDSIIALTHGYFDDVITGYPEDSEGAHDRMDFRQYLDDNQKAELQKMAQSIHRKRFAKRSMDESGLDSFVDSVDEEMLVSKEQRIIDDAKNMIGRGMDPESVVMSLASEYGLSHQEQFDLYNIVVQSPMEETGVKPDYIDLDNDSDTQEPMRKAAKDRERVKEGHGSVEEIISKYTSDLEDRRAYGLCSDECVARVKQYCARGDYESAADEILSNFSNQDGGEVYLDDVYADLVDDLKHLSSVTEDFDNGYNKQIEVDADGYFPKGAHHSIEDEAGPSSAKQGDNPMQKSIKESARLRLVKSFGDMSTKLAKVYKDADYGEYRVLYYVNDQYQVDADYHTDDKADAFETAKAFVSTPEAVRESKSLHHFLATEYRKFKKS